MGATVVFTHPDKHHQIKDLPEKSESCILFGLSRRGKKLYKHI